MKKTKALNEYLREGRIAAGLSQREVGEQLGLLTAQYISNVERGLTLPALKHLSKLIRMYRLSPRRVVDLYVADTHKKLKRYLT